MTEQAPAKASIFSSLNIRRKAPAASEGTLAHPLLGASTSSLNLSAPQSDAQNAEAGPSKSPTLHSRPGSWSKPPPDVASLPYKPRQRHGPHPSISSTDSAMLAGSSSASPTLTPGIPIINAPLSPAGVSAPPTTSTSTSATFALPPSATDGQDVAAMPALSGGAASATSRLQLQSLKAAAQKIGLGNGSMGMAMIDTIFEKSGSSRPRNGDSGDWGDVLKVLSGGKAILLLPISPSSSLPVTPQTLRDHIIYLGPGMSAGQTEGEDPAFSTSVAVTLSGLLCSTSSHSLTIESMLPPDAPLLQALRDASTRPEALSTLRPTQTACNTTFPNYDLSHDPANLVFPPPGRLVPLVAEKEKEKTTPVKRGRMNPFASLFAGSTAATPPLASSPSASGSPFKAGPHTPERSHSPTRAAADHVGSPVRGSSPRPSILSLDQQDVASILSEAAEFSDSFTVSSYTISKPIRQVEIHKSLTKALRSHVREQLDKLPDKVVDKVLRLLLPTLCPAAGSAEKELLRSHVDETSSTLDFSDPSACGERLQDFVEGVYDDLIEHYRVDSTSTIAEGLRRKGSGTSPWAKKDSEKLDEAASREKRRKDREEQAELQASEGTERVEALICRLIYNRLYSPLESDDARHDEALASRIAALNMLDLSLDHLGLITHPDEETGTSLGKDDIISRGLDAIAQSVGTEVQQLSSVTCLSAKAKADVLIKAHKLVVDGLARLPPIRLRPEGEPYRPATQASIEQELTDIHSPPNEIGSDDPLDEGDMVTPSLATVARLDPLDVSAAMEERTPHALHTTSDEPPPALDLPPRQDTPEPELTQIEEAMSESVHTLAAPPEFAEKESSPEREMLGGSSGADLILPIMIYSVVRANPPQLASQLMFLRRYRSAICLTGEASYAIVNLTAVIEFLEQVNLVDLGLGNDSSKVMSIEDLSPIGLAIDEGNADAASIASASSRLRGRVFQVGELAGSAAGSANKVITGVVDSSWTALRGLITTNPMANAVVSTESEEGTTLPSGVRPGMARRQASTFSLASVTASVASIAAAASTAAARSRSRANSRASEHVWTGNQELQDVVSRPESIREKDDEALPDMPTSEDTGLGIGLFSRSRAASDAKSIKSVTSTMKEQRDREREREREREKEKDKDKEERQSLSDRLASIGLGRLSSPNPSLSHILPADGATSPGAIQSKSPTTGFFANLTPTNWTPQPVSTPTVPPPAPASHPSTDVPDRPVIEPPIERFMTCEVGDIRLSEIGTLLRDYRRLANIVTGLPPTPRQNPP